MVGPLRAAAAIGLLLSLALAGCSGGGDGPDTTPEENAAVEELGLEATSTTGVIRGIVVDEAIRPIPRVAVTLTGERPQETQTTEGGAFGFDALAPGTYFLTASKPGFAAAQASVEVVAGVAEPPIVKVVLPADPASRPYSEAYTYDGFLECGVTTPAVGVALCLAPNLLLGSNVTTDKTQATYQVGSRPAWVQTEMVWESTQAAGGELALMYSWEADCGLLCDHEVSGTSPLLLQANQTVIDAIGLGNGTDLYIRVFSDDVDETRSPVVVCSPVEDPVFGATFCTRAGAGLTLEQKFTHYTHVFYGYAPPADWRFTSGAPVPAPPA